MISEESTEEDGEPSSKIQTMMMIRIKAGDLEIAVRTESMAMVAERRLKLKSKFKS